MCVRWQLPRLAPAAFGRCGSRCYQCQRGSAVQVFQACFFVHRSALSSQRPVSVPRVPVPPLVPVRTPPGLGGSPRTHPGRPRPRRRHRAHPVHPTAQRPHRADDATEPAQPTTQPTSQQPSRRRSHHPSRRCSAAAHHNRRPLSVVFVSRAPVLYSPRRSDLTRVHATGGLRPLPPTPPTLRGRGVTERGAWWQQVPGWYL